MPPTNPHARPQSGDREPIDGVRVLAEIPWLGRAPEKAPIAVVPQFSLAPQSLLATADVYLAAPDSAPHVPQVRRIDRPASEPLNISHVAPQVIHRAVVAHPHTPAPPIVVHSPATATTPAVAKQARSLPETIFLLHGAIVPYVRYLLLVAAITVVGVVMLRLPGNTGTPDAQTPASFAPQTTMHEAPPTLTAITPNPVQPKVQQPMLATPTVMPMAAIGQPFPSRRTEVSGPSSIARRHSETPAKSPAQLQLTPPANWSAYPHTSESDNLSLADQSSPRASSAEARLGDHVFPMTEQARYDDHQSSVH